MRVLFVTIPEKSHLFCLTPIAWAMRAAGHEVRVASCVELVDVISRTGMTAVATGRNDGISAAMTSHRESQEEWESASWNELDPAKLTYETELDRAQLATYGSAMYNEPMIDEMVEFARSWRPDLVIWDPLDVRRSPRRGRRGSRARPVAVLRRRMGDEAPALPGSVGGRARGPAQ